MKQFTKIAVVCALAVSLAACGSSASSTAASSAASSEAASSVAASSEAASEAASSEAASVAEGEGYTGTQTASAKGMNGDVTAGRRLATNRVKPIFCRQNHQIRRIPHVQTIVLQMQGFRAVGGDQVQPIVNLSVSHQLAHV